MKCFNCGSHDIQEEIRRGPVEYKKDTSDLDNSVIYADVPVMFCGACGYAWTDHRAEYIRQQIINSIRQG